MMLLFVSVGLVELRLPFLKPHLQRDVRMQLAVLLFWIIRAGAVPLIFAADRLMARRLGAGLLASAALLEALAAASGWTWWMTTVPRLPLRLATLTPAGAPVFSLVFIATAATAAAIRKSAALREQRIAEQLLDEDLAGRTQQLMQAELCAAQIHRSLELIESLIGGEERRTERAITATSDFLQLVIRRTGRDGVPLELELRLAAAAVELEGVIYGSDVVCRIEEGVPPIHCEVGALSALIRRTARAVGRQPSAVVRWAAQQAGDRVVALASVQRGSDPPLVLRNHVQRVDVG